LTGATPGLIIPPEQKGSAVPEARVKDGDLTTGTLSLRSDAELVAHVLEGHQDTYRELVRRYKNLVTAYVYSRVNKRELAEDLAQETFVRGFVSLCNLKKPEAFSSWVQTIAHNVCIDYLRHKSRTVSLETHGNQDSHGRIEVENRSERPVVDRLAQEELKAKVLEAIQGLGEEYRTTLLLRHVGGLSCEEIAETQGVSLGTVTSRLSRAHRSLRERLGRLVDPNR
jgi:RNA polymerase sigma-70 factor (ECF subfamily)